MLRYLLILLFIPFLFGDSFGAVENFETNKSVYHKGDRLVVSGTVSFDDALPFVTIQVFTPNKVSLAEIGTPSVGPDGRFSTSFPVGGPTWSSDGNYSVRVIYDDSMEKTIRYMEQEPDDAQEQNPDPDRGDTPRVDPEQPPERTRVPDVVPSTDPVTIPDAPKPTIPGFPALEKSPQHYIDRYNSEPAYRVWFDSQFPGRTIKDVVGYAPTHIDGFPALEKSPQHYIDRYNSEPAYRVWFDSQFPGRTIHGILGYDDPAPVPDWIRIDAGLWATGEISDSEFVDTIEFLAKNNMLSTLEDAPDDQIPTWMRNPAHWWSQSLITDSEFMNLLDFLILERFVVYSVN